MKRHIDLCCGIGAFTIVLREHGYRTILACDISPQVKMVYQANHGTEAAWQPDVFGITELPPCEILTAGAPCQSFSLAGNRLGFECPRNGGIFFQIMELIEKAPSKPSTVIFENVIGMKNIEGGQCLREIEDELRRIGYVVQTQQVNAEDFGSSATRSRLFIVARLREFEEEIMPLPPFPDPPMSVGKVSDHLEEVADDGSPHTWYDEGRYTVFPPEEWNHCKNVHKVMVGCMNNRKLKGSMDPRRAGSHSQSSRVYHCDGVYECITQLAAPIYVPHPMDSGLTGGRVRKLTGRERGNMFGFPRDFIYNVCKTHTIKMTANTISLYALRPLVAWALQEPLPGSGDIAE